MTIYNAAWRSELGIAASSSVRGIKGNQGARVTLFMTARTSHPGPFGTPYSSAVPGDYLLAGLVAPIWTKDQRIVWPTEKVRTDGMRFDTADFIRAVVDEVKALYKIDPKRIFVMGWSSSGPASYSAALTNPAITGAFISASIFRPLHFPPLEGAKGKRFYLVTSTEDSIVPPSAAEDAARALTDAGASVLVRMEQGPHNAWVASTAKPVQEGIEWLSSNCTGGQ